VLLAATSAGTDISWPDPGIMGEVDYDDFPDLSGVWTGSPKGGAEHRYFFTESNNHTSPPAKPHASYDVDCLTTNWNGGQPGGCGWNSGTCKVTTVGNRSNFIKAEATTVVTCTLDTGVIITGPLTGNRNVAFIDNKAPWNRFTGKASGLWYELPGGADDYFVMAHNETTNEVNVWWDTKMSKAGWTAGNGSLASDGTTLNLALKGFSVPTCDGKLSADGKTLAWSNCLHNRPKVVLASTSWLKRPIQHITPPPAPVHSVHLVFMNHLDIGYTNFINPVYNEYVHTYYQRAISIAQEMRSYGGSDRYLYGTHPMLMDLLLNCPPHMDLANNLSVPLQCPADSEVAEFKAAVGRGDIFWHAAPFNLQAENMDTKLFEAGLRMATKYDKMFYGEGPGARRTKTMSDRDVIYVSRSVVPLLAKYNITGLTIGSNGADYPPQVPKLHLWKDEQSGTEVIVAYHPLGYGGFKKNDCAEAPNGHALCTSFRSDNQGPVHTTDDVFAALDAVRQEYPKASVFSSTFDAFMEAVEPVKDQLPVVTREVGDTWMYGAPSDPLKMAQFRLVSRLWGQVS
jgi:hypothetical protein